MEHTIHEILSQRLYAITCGYADGNDAARLTGDPVHQLLVHGESVEGSALASQPTLSRFENAMDRASLYRMGEGLADRVIGDPATCREVRWELHTRCGQLKR